jgi:Tfp pilus assembly protein FimT
VTLIELMIVVVIMAVVVLAALPSLLQANNERDLAEASQDLAASIRAARFRAVSYNVATGIIVDADAEQVRMLVSPNNNCAGLANSKVVLDFTGTAIDIRETAGVTGQTICIRPSGQIADAFGQPWGGPPADNNGALRFAVSHTENTYLRARPVLLPFNGLARLGN